MRITQTQLQSIRIAANAPMSDTQILRDLIDSDLRSAEYQKALDGERYFSGLQDIKSHDFRTSYVIDTEIDPDTGSEKDLQKQFTNPNRSNIRTQHRFLYVQVEQKIAYISGREPSVSIDGAQASDDGLSGNEEWVYQTALADTTNSKFRENILEWQRQASIGGKAWLHEYKDRNGKLKQIVVPRTSGIAIYDTDYDTDLVEFIRHYQVTMNVSGKATTIRKAEWWTDKQVTFYTSDGDGNFTLDTDRERNPAPHFWEVTYQTAMDGVTTEETEREEKSWGRVPFIELRNNSQSLTDLDNIKDLIDVYDLISSEGHNNLMDFNEFWAVVQGFGGDIASSVMRKLRTNQAVGVTSTGGSVEMKQLDLQMQGRIDWLKKIWDEIYYYGMAVDTTKESLGQAASGTALEFQYSLLDLKANTMIAQAESAVSDHFAFITAEINRQNGTNYDPDLISISFNKSRPTNDQETVSMIQMSEGLVPELLLLQAHPLVQDPDEAYRQLLAEREASDRRSDYLFSNYGSTEPTGDLGDGEEE